MTTEPCGKRTEDPVESAGADPGVPIPAAVADAWCAATGPAPQRMRARDRAVPPPTAARKEKAALLGTTTDDAAGAKLAAWR